MNKVKMFFVAAALVLTTAGVFAGKAKFTNGPVTSLYYWDGTSAYHPVADGITTSTLQFYTTGGPGTAQAKISISGSAVRGLYQFDGSTHYYPAY